MASVGVLMGRPREHSPPPAATRKCSESIETIPPDSARVVNCSYLLAANRDVTRATGPSTNNKSFTHHYCLSLWAIQLSAYRSGSVIEGMHCPSPLPSKIRHADPTRQHAREVICSSATDFVVTTQPDLGVTSSPPR